MKKIAIVALAALSSLAAQAQIDLESKLVGNWQFDGSAIETNNVLNGTIAKPIGSNDRFGREGKALLFNGTSDVVSFKSPLLPIDGSDWTLSVWFNSTNSATSKHDVIFAQYGYNATGSSSRFHIFVMDNILWVFHGSFSAPLSLGAVSANQWSNVQISVKSQRMSAYRDGELKESNITITGIQDVNSDMGYINTSSIEHFSGSIDDMKIFSRSLSETELKYLQYETPKVCTEVVKDTVHVKVTDTLFMKFVATPTSEIGKESLVKIFPNPAKTDVQFVFSSELVGIANMLEITTVSGTVVHSSEITEALMHCSVSQIGGAAYYVVSIKNSTGVVLGTSNLQIVE